MDPRGRSEDDGAIFCKQPFGHARGILAQCERSAVDHRTVADPDATVAQPPDAFDHLIADLGMDDRLAAGAALAQTDDSQDDAGQPQGACGQGLDADQLR